MNGTAVRPNMHAAGAGTIESVRFGAAFWIQRTGWPELRAACLAAEAAGWDSVWLDDHLLSDEGDWTSPKLEGWAALAAVAALTQRVRLGLLVSANTFRNPGLIAKLATTLDHVSGGRAVLGIGGAWFEREHEAFGIAEWGSGFGERLDRLDEAVGLIRRLLDGERVSHEGRFYAFHDAVCAPRPVQARLPILVGGSGPKKTLRTVARYADAWNGYGSPERIAETLAHLRERCAEEGRPFEDIEKTVTLDNVVVRDTAAAARRWYDTIAATHGIDDPLDVGGPPAAVADALRPYADLGVGEIVWVFRSPWDVETIARLGEVRAALG
jgi:alkanesulfonate monooxygenase SsuD/methylene tetrahydromethanopterin reductase-like flavin-dependent oxidoreductase (luciferase family)